MTLTWPDKDPDEIADYMIDWVARLDGDTIVTSTWSVPAGLSKANESKTDNSAKLWLSGGTHGQQYVIVNQVVTAQGRTLEEGVILAVVSAGSLSPKNYTMIGGQRVDVNDPCALYAALVSYKVQYQTHGVAQEIEIQSPLTRRRTKFATGGDLDSLNTMIAEAKAACDAVNGCVVKPRRHAIRGGFIRL